MHSKRILAWDLPKRKMLVKSRGTPRFSRRSRLKTNRITLLRGSLYLRSSTTTVQRYTAKTMAETQTHTPSQVGRPRLLLGLFCKRSNAK